MNAKKFNLYAGGAIASLLFFLLIGFFSEMIYVGRGNDEQAPLAFAIVIEAPEAGGAGISETEAAALTEAVTEAATEAGTVTEIVLAAASEPGDFTELLAAADAKAGKKVFRKCRACHKVKEGKNGVGPSLWGVVGRDIASAEGYKFSDAMMGMEGTWTLANMFAFLESPKGFVPGTKMKYKGLKKPADRINVITYLNEADGSPEPLQ